MQAEGNVKISVTDDGPGIDPYSLQVFDPLFSLSGSCGYGLVWPLSKALRPSLRRPLSLFRRLLDSTAPVLSSVFRKADDLSAILVVDDEPQILRLLGHALEGAGYVCVTALNGRDALVAVRSQKPDLIILDLGLPDLDGKLVAGSIRQESMVPIRPVRSRPEAKKLPHWISVPMTMSPNRLASASFLPESGALLRFRKRSTAWHEGTGIRLGRNQHGSP